MKLTIRESKTLKNFALAAATLGIQLAMILSVSQAAFASDFDDYCAKHNANSVPDYRACQELFNRAIAYGKSSGGCYVGAAKADTTEATFKALEIPVVAARKAGEKQGVMPE